MDRRRRWISGLAATALLTASVLAGGVAWTRGGLDGPPAVGNRAFQVEPYLQPGDTPDGSVAGAADTEGLVLLWQTSDTGAEWSVELGGSDQKPWAPTGRPSFRRIDVGSTDVPPFRLYRSALTGLAPGSSFSYRVRRGGETVFQAEARTRNRAGAAQRFAVFGDCAADSTGQRAIAYQVHRSRPDYAVITGDVVYSRGRVSEYLDHFFSVYNAGRAERAVGAPLLRSTLVYASPGNHDLNGSDLDKYPDGLAFFYYWSQPRNGPALRTDGPDAPRLKGSDARRQAFLEAAGPAFPRGGNFSFDHGGAHWTIIDSNPYSDWTGQTLRNWLEADLASPAAQRAAWRFVAFHHPPFSSSKAHRDDQRMRLIAPLLERGKADVVFAGHVHNYQRTLPMRFVAEPVDGRAFGPNGQVPGTWTLDRAFDGQHQTRPDGPIYIVTGAGGARLYDPDQTDNPASWQPFTARFVSTVHSFTVVDATTEALTVRQVDLEGRELDRFLITR